MLVSIFDTLNALSRFNSQLQIKTHIQRVAGLPSPSVPHGTLPYPAKPWQRAVKCNSLYFDHYKIKGLVLLVEFAGESGVSCRYLLIHL